MEGSLQCCPAHTPAAQHWKNNLNISSIYQYIPVHTSSYQCILVCTSMYWYVLVHTGTYWYVQVCTGSGMYSYTRLRNYKLGYAIKFTQLQTRACKYRLVHASTYLYILAHRRSESCEWGPGLFYLLVSVSFDSEDLKRLRALLPVPGPGH